MTLATVVGLTPAFSAICFIVGMVHFILQHGDLSNSNSQRRAHIFRPAAVSGKIT
jgi:hypothetical protein